MIKISSLEDDKIKECKIVFDMFVTDNDSKITIKDLGDCLRVCGAVQDQKDLEMMIQFGRKWKRIYFF